MVSKHQSGKIIRFLPKICFCSPKDSLPETSSLNCLTVISEVLVMVAFWCDRFIGSKPVVLKNEETVYIVSGCLFKNGIVR